MRLKTVLVTLLVTGVLTSGCALAGPAQDVLEDLARSERNERLIAGYTALGIGAAIGLVSAAVKLILLSLFKRITMT